MMISEAIKAERKKKALTQKQLGLLCGVSKSPICQWERGNYLPSLKATVALATIFGEQFLMNIKEGIEKENE